MKTIYQLISLIFIASLSAHSANAEINIVSTIRPILYLVEGVNQGINPNSLLVSGNISPHDYQPKPSDIQKVKNADIIFRIDHEFQPRFNKIFSANAPDTDIILLAELPNLDLEATEQHLQESHADEHAHEHSHSSFDLHIWLSPKNAIIITNHVATYLSKLDPKNREKYQYNAGIQIEHLKKLDLTLHEKLAPYKGKNFFSYHDAYGYFTTSYGLNHSISITPSSHQLSAKKMQAIIKQANQLDVKCIMLEPHLNDKISKVVRNAKPDMRTATWDPLGFELKLNANSYHILMKSMADNLIKCFS
ncbi:MAG: zinc ABC transporter substrate-binding protein [Hyphomicrobiales bacterium]